ncbi:indole-3-glycerol phosphate synthase [Candidatus Peregrinibacteria bacterium CG_4_9_14_0_2_um_filter_53_11]|nr:MAG: indole-3-glycerol phosphate synthase [Candidatus Peregrinibacteria bacterium CG_4_9_14_0_2_um_filter_53_11]
MNFHEAISGKEKISIIAEIKRRSPSFGEFPQRDLATQLRAYEEGGAAAVSVVTDNKRFGGSLELMREVISLTSLPVLRKDFLAEKAELEATREAGAQAVLLIARELSQELLEELTRTALALELAPLIELHTQDDVAKARAVITNCSVEKYADRIMLGINNRDLTTFKTSPKYALNLIETDKKLFAQTPLVIESGITLADELAPYRGLADAALVGTSLLTSDNPKELLMTLTHV